MTVKLNQLEQNLLGYVRENNGQYGFQEISAVFMEQGYTKQDVHEALWMMADWRYFNFTREWKVQIAPPVKKPRVDRGLIVAIYIDEGDIHTIKVARTIDEIKPWLFDLTEKYWWAGYEPEEYPTWNKPDLKPKSLLQVMRFWQEERIMCGSTVVIKRVRED